MSPGAITLGFAPVTSRTTSLPPTLAAATRSHETALVAHVALASANRAKLVLFSPAGIVVAGALKPVGRFSSFSSIGPSYSSMRSALTVIGSALPLLTAGAVGVKLTLKLGRGGRMVR